MRSTGRERAESGQTADRGPGAACVPLAQEGKSKHATLGAARAAAQRKVRVAAVPQQSSLFHVPLWRTRATLTRAREHNC